MKFKSVKYNIRTNLRGMEFNYEMLEQQETAQTQTPQEENEVSGKMQLTHKESQQPEKVQTKKKESLTAERLAALRKIAPEINWEADTIMTEGEQGMNDAIDVISPALRVGGK